MFVFQEIYFILISRPGFYSETSESQRRPPQPPIPVMSPVNFGGLPGPSFMNREVSGMVRYPGPCNNRPGLLPLPPPSQMINPPPDMDRDSPGIDGPHRCRFSLIYRL